MAGADGRGMENSTVQWYAVKTKRYKENYVQSQLEYARIETYCPLMKIPKKHLRTGHRQIEPLFPGYVFARFEPTTQIFDLRRVRDAVSVVCFDGKPKWLDPRIIGEFRRREKGRGYISVRFGRKPPEAGDGSRDSLPGYAGLFAGYLESEQRIYALFGLLSPEAPPKQPVGSAPAVRHASVASSASYGPPGA